MLEQIINLVKDQAAAHFVHNTDVPNEHAETAANAASESILEVIQQQIAGGNMGLIQQLLGVGTTGGGNSDIMSMIIQQATGLLSGKLQNQVGVNAGVADSAAGSLIPTILAAVMDKFRSPAPADSGFDIGSLINMVLGGGNNQPNNQQVQNDNNPLGGLDDLLGGGGIGSILGNILGGGK